MYHYQWRKKFSSSGVGGGGGGEGATTPPAPHLNMALVKYYKDPYVHATIFHIILSNHFLDLQGR